WIASGSWDHTVRLWDAATGEPCMTLPHGDVVRTLAFSPDGRWLATGGDQDDRVRIWEVGVAHASREFQGPGRSFRFLAVSPDGTRIAATSSTDEERYHLSVCDVASGKQLFSARGAALAYSPDGRWLAARSAEGDTVVLLDAKTHREAKRFRGHK